MTKEVYKNVKLSEVQESKTNPRKSYDNAALKELAESIKQHGIIQPLVVRAVKKGYELVAGSRRLRAAKEAKLKEIPVVVKDLTDDQVIEIQIIENLQRQDIHPLDEAEGFKNLIESKKYTVESIAEKVGKSTVYVYQRIRLNSLVTEIKKLFRDNHCSYGQAAVIARLLPDVQKKLYQDVYRNYNPNSISLGELKDWIARHSEKDLSKARFDINDHILIKSAGACNSCPKNTACDSQLFPDFANKKICTDVKCYDAKLRAHIEKKFAELKAKDINAVMVSDDWGSSNDGFENVITRNTYSDCNKNDKGARIAIVVSDSGQSEIGRVKYITTEKTSSSIRSGSGKSLSEKTNEARNKNNNIVRTQVLNIASENILADVKELLTAGKPLHQDIRKLFLKMAFDKIDHDTRCKLKNLLHWDLSKYKNGGFVDYDKFFIDNFIDKATDDQSFLFYLLWALLASKTLGPCCYVHWDDKFRSKDYSDGLRIDFIYQLAGLYNFDYPGKLKELNDESIAKLKEKSKPAKKSKSAK